MRAFRSGFAEIVSLGGAVLMLLVTSTAFGAGAPELASADDTESNEPGPWSVAVRAFKPFGDAILGGGLDVAHSVVPRLAVGAQYTWFVADQGADPQYCTSCVYNGASAFAFAEGRHWPELWLTPYARLGAGVTYLTGQDAESKPQHEYNLGILTEVGLEFHPEWFSLRAFLFQHFAVASEFDESSLSGVGVQLGARL